MIKAIVERIKRILNIDRFFIPALKSRSEIESIDSSFWEKQHTENDHYWLTGSDLTAIMQFHGFTPDAIRGKKILEIGVGKGNLIHELKKYSDKIICCDISEAALSKVKDVAYKTYLSKDLNKIEPVDFALCHLVFQHCTNQEVERIINDVNLNVGAVFTFQFAYLRDNDPPNKNVVKLINSGSHYFRTLDEIKIMVEKANKQIVSTSKPFDFFTPENFSWLTVRIENK